MQIPRRAEQVVVCLGESPERDRARRNILRGLTHAYTLTSCKRALFRAPACRPQSLGPSKETMDEWLRQGAASSSSLQRLQP